MTPTYDGGEGAGPEDAAVAADDAAAGLALEGSPGNKGDTFRAPDLWASTETPDCGPLGIDLDPAVPL